LSGVLLTLTIREVNDEPEDDDEDVPVPSVDPPNGAGVTPDDDWSPDTELVDTLTEGDERPDQGHLLGEPVHE
jgi:hypothetical protein